VPKDKMIRVSLLSTIYYNFEGAIHGYRLKVKLLY